MRPVFIGGCPRSGTTLLGSMLGCNEQSICTPESYFKIGLLRTFGNTAYSNLNPKLALRYLQKDWRFRIWKLDISDLPSVHGASISYIQLINWIIKKYSNHINKPEAKVWIDHTPGNLASGSKLAELFATAKFIHIVRDGRAVASSVMPLNWGPNTIANAAHWWLEQVSHGLAAETYWSQDRIIRVSYEQLVREPEHTLKQICVFLDIDYSPEMITGRGLKVPEYTSTQHALVGQKPDINRIDSWETRLTPRQIEIFEGFTFSVLEYLGYETKYGVCVKKMTFLERNLFRMQEVFYRGLPINKIRHWLRLKSALH